MSSILERCTVVFSDTVLYSQFCFHVRCACPIGQANSLQIAIYTKRLSLPHNSCQFININLQISFRHWSQRLEYKFSHCFDRGHENPLQISHLEQLTSSQMTDERTIFKAYPIKTPPTLFATIHQTLKIDSNIFYWMHHLWALAR